MITYITYKRALNLLFTIIISVVASANVAGNNVKAHGLQFYSFNESQGKRTSLSLNDNEPFALSKQLDIQFDIMMRSDGVLFGDILNINPNTGSPIRMAIAYKGGKPQLELIQGKRITPMASLPMNQWLTMRLGVDAASGNIKVSFGNVSRNITVALRQASKATVAFGFDAEISRDVPSMNIRNVKVAEGGKLARHWLLDKHNDSICYDQVARSVAVAKSGMWLIDTHSRLTQIFSGEYATPVELAVDVRHGQFVVVDKKHVDYYDGRGNLSRSVPVVGESPKFNVGNAIVSPLDSTLLVYSIDNNTTSAFDPSTGRWTTPEATLVDNSYYNHARAWDVADSSYYCFGGYGHFRYRNDLLRYDMRTRQWTHIGYKPLLSPRYSASAAIHGDYMYILGGRGNDGGQQSLTTYSYYTLNRIDLRTGRQTLLWEMPATQKDKISFVLSASMIYREATHSLYTVCMDGNDILLLKLGLKEPGWTIVDKIRIEGDGYEAIDMNLYDCQAAGSILLVVNRKSSKMNSSVNVYALTAPILTSEDIMQTDGNTGASIPWALSIAVGLSVIAVAAYCTKRRLHKRHTADATTKDASPAIETTAEPGHQEQTATTAEPQDNTEPQDNDDGDILPMVQVQHKSFIQLLGEFRVFDRNGSDITSQCTPKLKELLLVIIFNCEKERSGHFPAERISDQLWPDKEGQAARNNRNVSMRKLRTYLAEVGDIDISGNNSVISIDWHDVTCDYHEVMQEAKKGGDGNLSSIRELSEQTLAYLFSGTLLPDNNDPWLDDFKSNFSFMSLDYLENLLMEEIRKEHADNVLRIADIMLKHDPFNESALAAKCRTLVKSNKRGVAKNVYQSFCREYEKSLGEAFDYSFADIIGSEGKGWKLFK